MAAYAVLTKIIISSNMSWLLTLPFVHRPQVVLCAGNQRGRDLAVILLVPLHLLHVQWSIFPCTQRMLPFSMWSIRNRAVVHNVSMSTSMSSSSDDPLWWDWQHGHLLSATTRGRSLSHSNGHVCVRRIHKQCR